MCISIGSPARLCDPRSRSSACATQRSGPSWVTIATSTLPSSAGAALDQALDRDAGIAHRRGDLGQHARPVGDGEAQIGAAAALAGVGRGLGSASAAAGIAKAGRYSPRAMSIRSATTALAVGPSPAPRALEQQAADEIALRHHRVGRAGDVRERMVERHEVRVDALEQPVGAGLGEAEQADAIAERRRLGDVGGEHVADAGDRDRRRTPAACRRRALARIDSLCAASTPSMSKLGSASA